MRRSLVRSIYLESELGVPTDLDAAGTALENPYVYDSVARDLKGMADEGLVKIVREQVRGRCGLVRGTPRLGRQPCQGRGSGGKFARARGGVDVERAGEVRRWCRSHVAFPRRSTMRFALPADRSMLPGSASSTCTLTPSTVLMRCARPAPPS